MHTLFILLSLLLAVLGGYAALGALRRVEDWRQRRRLELLVLAAPAVSLGVGAICPRPVALGWGVRRATVLLSTWMLEHLDAHELDAVLAHELGHAARHDAPAVWLATVLRDAFFYLPTSRLAYRQLQADKELASDDLAVGVTERPLALASALAKVWQQALGDPALGAAQAFADEGSSIEQRIARLVDGKKPQPVAQSAPAGVVGFGASALVGLLALQASGLVVMFLDPLSCGPMSPLWRLL